MILFLKEVQEAESELNKDLLVVHRYFEVRDTSYNKEIDEFLINEAYCC